jgi:hypothetical protein
MAQQRFCLCFHIVSIFPFDSPSFSTVVSNSYTPKPLPKPFPNFSLTSP